MNNKTKAIAYGGVMVALFIALNICFQIDIRCLQTILNIVRSIPIALFSIEFGRKKGIMVGASAILLSVILLPLNIAIVYAVPSIVVGWLFAVVFTFRKEIRVILGTMIYVIANIYYLATYKWLFGFDLFSLYLETFKETIQINKRIIDACNINISVLLIGMIIVSIVGEALFNSLLLSLFLVRIRSKWKWGNKSE